MSSGSVSKHAVQLYFSAFYHKIKHGYLYCCLVVSQAHSTVSATACQVGEQYSKKSTEMGARTTPACSGIHVLFTSFQEL